MVIYWELKSLLNKKLTWKKYWHNLICYHLFNSLEIWMDVCHTQKLKNKPTKNITIHKKLWYVCKKCIHSITNPQKKFILTLRLVVDRYGNFHLTDTDMLIIAYTDTRTDQKKTNSPIPIPIRRKRNSPIPIWKIIRYRYRCRYYHV